MQKSILIPIYIATAYGIGVLHAGGAQTVRIKEPRTQADYGRLIDSMKKDLVKLDGIVEDEFDAHAELLKAVKRIEKERRMSFNLQYATLQEKMQSENRQYRTVSNIMKTKHDTVKNSIANIR